jgi:hypothetical protein
MTEATRALLLAKIAKVFPDRDTDEILAILDRYGTGKHEQEPAWVQLAVLKLCDEEGRDDPAHYIDVAKQDFRDVLAWAEYPNLMRRPANINPKERAALEDRDMAQYRAWLDKP